MKKNPNTFLEEVVGCKMVLHQERKIIDKRNISKFGLRESTCPLADNKSWIKEDIQDDS